MAFESQLSRFVRDALDAGRSSEDIRATLTQAGWTDVEIEAELDGWTVIEGSGAVPRPVRSTAARDAFFYALLFIVFGVIVGNALSLWFAQTTIWLPDPDDRYRGDAASGLRWSIAALIVFVPVFWWLDRTDRHAKERDPARQFLTVRRWLSAIALLCAVIALLGDALFLIFRWLDGQMTVRFVTRAMVVAGMAVIVLAYFQEGRHAAWAKAARWASWALIIVAAAAVALSLSNVGGPAQGAAERRDQIRLSDMNTLARDLENCAAFDLAALPEAFNPLDCARNPDRLSAYAADVRYHRSPPDAFELCIYVEAPDAITQPRLRITDTEVCLRERVP